MEFSFTLMHGRTVSTCVCGEIRDKNTQSGLGKEGRRGDCGKKRRESAQYVVLHLHERPNLVFKTSFFSRSPSPSTSV